MLKRNIQVFTMKEIPGKFQCLYFRAKYKGSFPEGYPQLVWGLNRTMSRHAEDTQKPRVLFLRMIPTSFNTSIRD